MFAALEDSHGTFTRLPCARARRALRHEAHNALKEKRKIKVGGNAGEVARGGGIGYI